MSDELRWGLLGIAASLFVITVLLAFIVDKLAQILEALL